MRRVVALCIVFAVVLGCADSDESGSDSNKLNNVNNVNNNVNNTNNDNNRNNVNNVNNSNNVDCDAGEQDNDGDGTCSPACADDSCGRGTCDDSSGLLTCTCQPGYAGDDCSECDTGYQDNDADGVCTPSCAMAQINCPDNAECDDSSGALVCECEFGYQDNDGDTSCEPGCAADACNGQGTCDDSGGLATCTCTNGFGGEDCSECAEGLQDNNSDDLCEQACILSGLRCIENVDTSNFDQAAADSACPAICSGAGLVYAGGFSNVAADLTNEGCEGTTMSALCDCELPSGNPADYCLTTPPATFDQAAATTSCPVLCEAVGLLWDGTFSTDVQTVKDANCNAADDVICGCDAAPGVCAGLNQECDDSTGAAATCACAPGTQDNDGDFDCTRDCANTTCGDNSTCDDGSGTATCVCDAGFVDPDGDTRCSEPADLDPRQLSCPALVAPGEPITCAVQVMNPTVSSSDIVTQVGFFLSTDTNLDTGDSAIMNCDTPILQFDLARITCTGVVPAASNGDYYVIAEADTNQELPELDETNNLATTAVVVDDRPDLVVSSVDCRTIMTLNKGYECTVGLENAGAVDVPSGYTIAMRSGLTTLGSCTGPSVPANGSDDVTCGLTTPGNTGTLFINAVADFGNSIAEIDESNNSGTAAAFVTPMSEVVVDSIVCPVSAALGQTVTCDVQMSNTSSTATGVFDIALHASTDTTITSADLLLGTCSASSLPANSTATAACSVLLPVAQPGDFIGVIADSSDLVGEIDESSASNTDYWDMSYRPAGPDLIVEAFDCPDTMYLDGAHSCTITVRNQGALDAGATDLETRRSTDATITGADTLLSTCTLPAVAAGAEAVVECSTTNTGIATGAYFMGVRLDPSDTVAETNDGNNSASESITLDPLANAPDLTITGVFCNPDPVAVTNRVTCHVVVENIGVDAAPSADVQIHLSTNSTITALDPLIATCTIPELASGGTTNVTCSGTVSTNATHVGALIPADSIVESSTSNNTDSEPIAIIDLPNLVVSSLSCPAVLTSGVDFTCDVTIQNTGTGDAAASTADLMLSQTSAISLFDKLVGSCSFPAIAVGGSETVSCVGNTIDVPDDYYIGVIADPADMVSESKEGDNTRATADPVTLN